MLTLKLDHLGTKEKYADGYDDNGKHKGRSKRGDGLHNRAAVRPGSVFKCSIGSFGIN